MIEAIGHLRRGGLVKPVCIAVHAVFSGSAVQDLTTAAAGSIVSCDTIAHPSNTISIAPDLADAVRELLQAPRGTPVKASISPSDNEPPTEQDAR